jgi:hypothetical protein
MQYFVQILRSFRSLSFSPSLYIYTHCKMRKFSVLLYLWNIKINHVTSLSLFRNYSIPTGKIYKYWTGIIHVIYIYISFKIVIKTIVVVHKVHASQSKASDFAIFWSAELTCDTQEFEIECPSRLNVGDIVNKFNINFIYLLK